MNGPTKRFVFFKVYSLISFLHTCMLGVCVFVVYICDDLAIYIFYKDV